MMRNSIEIAGIILPILVIILSVTRIFLKKTRGVNGLVIICAILLLVIGMLQYFVFKDKGGNEPESKLPPLAVSAHSETFNRSMEQVLRSYVDLSASFAGSDTAAIRDHAVALSLALDSFPVNELKVDTLIYETAVQPLGNARAEVTAIANDPVMEEKRASFNVLSNELYSLFRVVRYDLARLYWMECPAAFGEDRPGNWIATTETSANPYNKGECAELRSTIDFVKKDSTIVNGPTKN